jgi:hypothetical protein
MQNQEKRLCFVDIDLVSLMVCLSTTRNFGFAGHIMVPFLMVVAFDRMFSSTVAFLEWYGSLLDN